jgi:phospholipid transport system substrate-binding protein
MKMVFIKIVTLLSIVVFSNTLLANEEELGMRTVFSEKLEKILETVQDTKLSTQKRNKKILDIITPMTDFALMAKLSLGKKTWLSLNKEDQSKFVELYVKRMEKSYSSKLDGYKDQKIEILSITQKKNRIFIKTEVVGNSDSLKIEYKYYKPKKRKENKDKWLIYDVEVIGISILKADKAQFREYLKRKTITQLMDELSKQ